MRSRNPESRQARFSVTVTSRSARTTVFPIDSAVWKAATISSPGALSKSTPTRFWNAARTMFANRRNPLPSRITFRMSRPFQRSRFFRDW